MTKNEIKAALDLAGVSYAKKANLETLQGLLDAHNLAQHEAARNAEAESHGFAEPDTGAEGPGAALLDQIIADVKAEREEPSDEELRTQRINTFTVGERDISEMACPCCGIQLDNGVTHYMGEGANGTVNTQTREWQCLGCGGEFGHEVTRTPAPKATGTGLKIEKDREEKNGIKRPSIGGKCRAIWDALDQHAETTGDDPTAKDVKALAAEHGWNPNNASIEFYQWRKFHGIAKGK